MTNTIMIESIPQGIFRDMEKSNSSSDTPYMVNIGSFDTMDTIETILDETMAVDDMTVLTQKRGLFKRLRSRNSKSAKKEGQQKTTGRKLMGRLSFGKRSQQPKLVVVETQPKMLGSSYTVASEESPVHEEEESTEIIKESKVPATTTTDEVVEEVSPTKEIVETITSEVSVADASIDDGTPENETIQEIVDLQEEAVEVPELIVESPVEPQDEIIVEDNKDEVTLLVISVDSDDLLLTMEFDEEEVETSTEEIVEEIIPEKAPYHQDSADYVGLALVGLFVTLLASPIFQ